MQVPYSDLFSFIGRACPLQYELAGSNIVLGTPLAPPISISESTKIYSQDSICFPLTILHCGCGRKDNLHDISNQRNKVAAPAEAWKNTGEQIIIIFFSAATI